MKVCGHKGWLRNESARFDGLVVEPLDQVCSDHVATSFVALT